MVAYAAFVVALPVMRGLLVDVCCVVARVPEMFCVEVCANKLVVVKLVLAVSADARVAFVSAVTSVVI